MAKFLISYDYHRQRDYSGIHDLLENKWKAARLLESLWLASVNGTADQVLDAVVRQGDEDDSFAVIELKPGSDWQTRFAEQPGYDWLNKHILRK